MKRSICALAFIATGFAATAGSGRINTTEPVNKPVFEGIKFLKSPPPSYSFSFSCGINVIVGCCYSTPGQALDAALAAYNQVCRLPDQG